MALIDVQRYAHQLRVRRKFLIKSRGGAEITSAEWRRIYMGALPVGDVQAMAHEGLLISSLRHRWQRFAYRKFLARFDSLPTPQSRERARVVSRVAKAVCACYVLLASLYLVMFCRAQHAKNEGYDKNFRVFVEVCVSRRCSPLGHSHTAPVAVSIRRW
jgi:hypothetical protein